MLRLLPLLLVTMFLTPPAQGAAYKRAVEDKDNVKLKLYPKRKKSELDVKFGLVLNSSFVQTMLVNGGYSFFFSEEWGMLIEANMAMNSDKSERECLETFYNDPNSLVGSECGDGADWDEDANWGPAYMGIRELNMIFAGSAVWNPIYGKQIIFLSGVGHFDRMSLIENSWSMPALKRPLTVMPTSKPSKIFLAAGRRAQQGFPEILF